MPRSEPPVTPDMIVIGGSAGSIPVLQAICRGLPADLPAAVLIVVHQAQSQPGKLPEVLGGPLPARHAQDGEPIEIGRVYVAPPDQHLLVEPAGRVRLSRGPKQNRFRPAIDPLFRTAARVFGPQVVGVVLSGLLDDGTFGLMQVKRFGGIAVVQDPRDADAGDMPASAIHYAKPDYVLRSSEIADTLNRLVREPGREPPQGARDHVRANHADVVRGGRERIARHRRPRRQRPDHRRPVRTAVLAHLPRVRGRAVGAE